MLSRLMADHKHDPVERFLTKILIKGDDECWPWMAGLSENGYGRFWDGERQTYAHIFMFRLCTGRSPQVVHHVCGRHDCLNPGHIADVGTQFEHHKHHPKWGNFKEASSVFEFEPVDDAP